METEFYILFRVIKYQNIIFYYLNNSAKTEIVKLENLEHLKNMVRYV